MPRAKRPPDLVVNDPTGELNGGLPTYHWNQAPPGLLTRRQLADKGLRKGGQAPAAQIRRSRGWTRLAYLYDVDLAKPQFAKSEAKMAAVWTAARSRRRCDYCGPVGYIPKEGVCETCREKKLAA